MGKIAFVFAGQGSQYTGMGEELYNNSPAAKRIFDISDSVRKGTSTQCFTAEKAELSKTSNTQPCLYTVDLAAANALVEKGINPHAVAGFSLGELSALTFAGAFADSDGIKAVCKRGELMERAAESTNGGMAAILKLDNKTVENICSEFDKMYPVNYNCPGQLVVAGDRGELDAFCEKVAEKGGKTRVLAVSGGFHSPFMDEAYKGFEKYLKSVKFSQPSIPVYSNLTATPYSGDYISTLANQMRNPVKWQQTVENMAADGFTTFIEVGPGKTLSGLIKRILPEAKICRVDDLKSLEDTLTALNN